jgi:glycosyltransferase involved in cell wall biosynthesis
VAGDLLHVVVGHGLPGLYLNTLRSFRAVLPDAPLLVVDNASPQRRLRQELEDLAARDPAMELVLRERNEGQNGKVGGLYEAYRLAFERADGLGARYVHIMQADMQLLWWDEDVVKRAEDLFRRHPTCVNIMTAALSRDRWLAGDLCTDAKTGDTLVKGYGLTDTGLFHLARFSQLGASFETTEAEHGRRAYEAGMRVAVFAWPTEVPVPWPAVVRHGKQQGREVRTEKPLLCQPLSSADLVSLKASGKPVTMEEICVPWGWSCLSPMWTTDLDNVHYWALRRRDLAVNGWRAAKPRWVTGGLDRRSDILLKPRRPSLTILLARPIWAYCRAFWYRARPGQPGGPGRPRRLAVLAAPRDDNPYQELLYGELRKAGVRVRYEEGPTASQSLNVALAPAMLARYRLAGYTVLHLHWVFQFSLPSARSQRWARRAMQSWFAFYLRTASWLGFTVVWTAHDLAPHEPVFADDRRAHKDLAARADLVIALSPASAEELSRQGARAVRVVPFGAYGKPTLSPSARAEARHALGWRPEECVVVHFGKLLPYKGADTLLRAAHLLPPASGVRVVVAGACRDQGYAELLRTLAHDLGRADLRLERLSDEEMGTFLLGADLAAFPFREVTNSSSLLNAQCYGLPVLIPDLPGLRDFPERSVLRYDGSAHGLAKALEGFVRLTPEERRRIGESARAYATSADWPTVATMTLEAFQEATAAKQARRRRPS